MKIVRRRHGDCDQLIDQLARLRKELDRSQRAVETTNAVMESLPLAIHIRDADGVTVTTGQRPLYDAPTRVLIDEAVENAFAAVATGEGLVRTVDLFGPPRVVVTVEARPLAGGAAVVKVDDISDRVRLDGIRTDFVANVSHEIKTPVGALALLAETLGDCDDPDVAQRLSARLVSEAHRVSQTVDELLELADIEYGVDLPGARVDIDLVVTTAIDRVDSFASTQGVDISFQGRGAQAYVDGDQRQLVSAIRNLLENAVKFSHAGGQVTVKTIVDSGTVTISVHDDGIGIPDKDLGRIFERFYRVDAARSRETGGTGLGLSIVRHVASNHGGSVAVNSHEGEGSTFMLSMPHAAAIPGEQHHG